MSKGRLQALAPILFGFLFVAFGILVAGGGGPFHYIRLKYFDWMRVEFVERRALDGPAEPVVIVGYDDESEQAYGLTPPRQVLADVIRRVGDAGAKVIALDFLLTNAPVTSAKVNQAIDDLSRHVPPSNRNFHDRATELRGIYDEDAALVEALAKYPVIESYGNAPRAVTPDAWKMLAESDRVDTNADHPEQCASAAPDQRHEAIFDEPRLFSAATMHASAMISPDLDGTVRRYPLVVHVQQSPFLYPTLGARAAAEYLEEGPATADCDGLFISSATIGTRYVTSVMNPSGLIMLDFGGSFAEAFPNYVSAKRALEKKGDAWVVPDSRFAGKIVFIGPRSDDVDKYTTPYDTNFSGVGFHATAARSLVTGQFLRWNESYPVEESAAMLLVWLVCVFVLSTYPGASAALSTFNGLLLPAGHYATVVLLRKGYMVDAFWPALFAAVGFFATLATRYFSERRRAESTKKELGSFLSPEVVEIALRDPQLLAPARRDISVLFSDIRGFTTTAEGMAPEALAALLEGYLTRMTEIVFEQRGTLDKYIGDAVMALFGAPNPFDDHPVYACRAALTMMSTLAEMQKEWHAKGQPILDIGIGVNSGTVAVGRMGSRAKAEYTCLGDEVNFASRLEGLNKAYGTHVLVGESTRTRVGDRFVFRDLGLVQVKGKTKATRIYELISEADGTAAPEWISTWERALAAFLRREWDEAEKGFGEVIRARGDDNASTAFLGFIHELRANPPSAEWQGTIERHEK